MDIGQFIALLLGSSVLTKAIDWLMSKRNIRADADLKDAQVDNLQMEAAERAVKLALSQVAVMETEMKKYGNQITVLNLKVDSLELYLTRADYALTSLVKHPGIKKDYPSEVERAVRIRRGTETWDETTPLNF
jgi:hypothetical protein